LASLAPRAVGHECSPDVIDRVASTSTPQPILAVARRPRLELPDAPSLMVLCEELNDPGNLGTIVRAAEAAGADAVALTTGSVDPWNPKVVRAAAGSLFRLPVLSHVAVGRLPIRHLAAVAAGAPSLDDVDLREPVCFVLGNEARGLSAAGVSLCEGAVMIPMAGPTESLNVAMAATVLLFEAARQRRRAS
jgi:TrmH family RNA methyltransferase